MRVRSSPRTSRSSDAGGSCTSRRAERAVPPRSPQPTGAPWPMAELLRQAWAVARKDLLLEFRTRTAIVSAVVFTALVFTVFNFGRDPTAVSALDLAPTILWVTFTFAAMLALNRAFQLELENQALEGLLVSPLSRTSLYWGKLIANLVFVAVGTLFSALVIRTRFAELLLVVILLPFLVPPLIGAVQVTARLLGGRPLSESMGYLKLLAAYDIVFVSLASFLFRFTVDE